MWGLTQFKGDLPSSLDDRFKGGIKQSEVKFNCYIFFGKKLGAKVTSYFPQIQKNHRP